MTRSIATSHRTTFKAAALLLGAVALPAVVPGAVSVAHARSGASASDVRGLFQAAENPAILNDFIMDVFGGLEVTPIRDGRRGTTVVYRKTGTNTWEEVGGGKKQRATYQFTRSGAFLWTSANGSRRILLTRQGQAEVATNQYMINGKYKLDGTEDYNHFEMIGANAMRVTPYRSGRAGRSVIYDRTSASQFKDRNGSGTYEALSSNHLVWKSNDGRDTRIVLTEK